MMIMEYYRQSKAKKLQAMREEQVRLSPGRSPLPHPSLWDLPGWEIIPPCHHEDHPEQWGVAKPQGRSLKSKAQPSLIHQLHQHFLGARHCSQP